MAAQIDITNVRTEHDSLAPGAEVQVFVEVEETSPSGGDFESAYVVIESPQFGETVLTSCFLIEQGGSDTRSQSTVSGTLNGSFTMPDEEVQLNVYAGNYQDNSRDPACAYQLLYGDQTDQMTVVLEPQAKKDPYESIAITNITTSPRPLPPPTPPFEQDVQIEVTLMNGADVGINVTGTVDANGGDVGSFSGVVPGISERTFAIDFSPQTANQVTIMVQTAGQSASETIQVESGDWFEQFAEQVKSFIEPFPVELGINVSNTNPEPGEPVQIIGTLTWGGLNQAVQNGINSITPNWFPDINIPTVSDFLNWLANQYGVNVGQGVAGKQVVLELEGPNGTNLYPPSGSATDSNGNVSASFVIPENTAGQTLTARASADRQNSPVETASAEATVSVGVSGSGNGGNGDNGGNGGNGGSGENGGLGGLGGLVLLGAAVLSQREKDS